MARLDTTAHFNSAITTVARTDSVSKTDVSVPQDTQAPIVHSLTLHTPHWPPPPALSPTERCAVDTEGVPQAAVNVMPCTMDQTAPFPYAQTRAPTTVSAPSLGIKPHARASLGTRETTAPSTQVSAPNLASMVSATMAHASATQDPILELTVPRPCARTTAQAEDSANPHNTVQCAAVNTDG